MLQQIKLLLGITDSSKDQLLTLLIAQCQQDIKNYTHNDLSDMDSVLCQMVVHRYNRLGTEGVSSESFSGVSYGYSDYPEFIIAQLKSHRKLMTL